MSMIKKTIQLLSFLFFSYQAVAAKDPISWVLTQSLPAVLLVEGGTYVTAYSFTNQIPMTMVNPLTILKTSNSASEFSFNDLCTGKRLAFLETCRVTIYLNPVSSGTKTVQLTEVYGHDRVPLPVLNSLAIGSLSTGVTGDVTTLLPVTMQVSESANWMFSFTNNGTEPATGINIAVPGTTFRTTCSLPLLPNHTCTVSGTYTAPSAGQQTILATFSYAQGAAVTLSTSTHVDGQSGGLVCTAAAPLPPEVLDNSVSNVTLLCTNKSGAAITIDNHVPTYPVGGVPGTFVPDGGGDNCTAQVLVNGGSCQLKGVYTAPAAGTPSNVTISLLVNYHTIAVNGLSSSVSTATDVVAAIINNRNISLVNNCSFDVWWSMVGGAVGGSSCVSNSDCPIGSSCNVSSGICYYNNYAPTTGTYQIVKNGGTAETEIIASAASINNILWSGLISASTACDGSSTCLNNACDNNGGASSCTPGVGFQQPATEAEFTFLLVGGANVDTYDISNVNGFSMPISMATDQPVSNYTCGTAGNNVAVGGLGACNFSSVTPPTNMYYWVSNTGTACSGSNTCGISGQICGLAFSPSANNFTKNCGDFLGYWAANEICQTNPAFTSPFGDNFSCNQVLNTPFPTNAYTLTQLLKCSPPSSTAPLFNSCYGSYPGYSTTDLPLCCGCTNWPGITTPSASCPAGQVDPQWTSYVQPIIQWMKQACPTSYSYPYDDKASTFQCTAAPTTHYTITFCPGGGTGLPSGKTDGRGS
jgi:hypothetical protein